MLSLILLRDFPNNRDKPWPELGSATKAVFSAQGDRLVVRFGDGVENGATVRSKSKHWWGGFHEDADAMPHCMQLESGPALLFERGMKPLWAFPFGTGQAAWFGDTEFDSVILSRTPDGALVVKYRTGRTFVTSNLTGSYGRWTGNV